MKKIHVLEICLGRFLASGSSVMVWNWYQHFDLTKLDVDFFTMEQPDEFYLSEIKRRGSKCFYWNKKRNPLIRKIMKLLVLYKIIQNNNYDCIHVHVSRVDFILAVYLFSKKSKSRVIVHSHNSNAKISLISRIFHNIGKILLKNADIIYFSCSDLAAKWMFPKKIVDEKKYITVQNGIDVSNFVYNCNIRERIRQKLCLESRFVVGHVGRFSVQKNHEFLIKVFASVKAFCPNACLLLVGDGEEGDNLKEKIKEQIKSLGLENYTIFYGNTDKVFEVYQAMDCFILTSLFEGLPIAAIEAQAAGLRTLLSDTITKEAKITDLAEYLSLDESVQVWAEKILSYNSGDERKNMSNQIIKAGFDISGSARFIERQYEFLANNQMSKTMNQYENTRGGV